VFRNKVSRLALFWDVMQCWLVVYDVSGRPFVPRTSVTTSRCCVTSQKSKYLIYTTAKAWNLVSELLTKFPPFCRNWKSVIIFTEWLLDRMDPAQTLTPYFFFRSVLVLSFIWSPGLQSSVHHFRFFY